MADLEQIVLASGSPQRLALMRQLGLEPLVDPADIDEAPLTGEKVSDLVARLARSKAETVFRRRGEVGLVLGADSLVALGEQILSKPKNETHAREMITSLSATTHIVMTGHCLISPESLQSSVEITRVSFRELHSTEIDSYLQTGEWRNKAGACSIQGFGESFVEGIYGSYSNVVGLSLGWLGKVLTGLGYAYHSSWRKVES